MVKDRLWKLDEMKTPPVSRIILYVRNLPQVAAFYEKHFGLRPIGSETRDSIELSSPSGGCILILLQASKGHQFGQSCIKIVFDVKNVRTYREKCKQEGLTFGTIHRGDGYEFSNARDPAKNPIQISSRFLKKTKDARGSL